MPPFDARRLLTEALRAVDGDSVNSHCARPSLKGLNKLICNVFVQFTVEAVVTESVSVHWQCRALCTHPADAAAPQQPKFLVEG